MTDRASRSKTTPGGSAFDSAPSVSDVIVARVERPSSDELVRAVISLVEDGTITLGTRLPTVRALAAQLGMSSSAVGQAWRRLREENVVATRTKSGTTVIHAPQPPRPERFTGFGIFSSTTPTPPSSRANFAAPIPDVTLLPDLVGAFVAAGGRTVDLHSPTPVPITPALRDAVRATWPLTGPSLLATHKSMEALELVLRTRLKRGERVAVEDPTVPRVLDIVDLLGCVAVPVPWGASGPSLASLRRALARGAKAFIYQPSVQVPTGRSATPEWSQQAADLVREFDAVVVELSDYSFLADDETSLTSSAPAHCVHVRGFSYSHGHDTRVTVVSGGRQVIDEMTARLDYSSRWVSRLMQDALAHMLTDPLSRTTVERAATAHRAQRERMVAALTARGVASEAGAAPCLWVPVPDDTIVVDALAVHGMTAAPARSFEVRAARERHIHLSTTHSTQDFGPYADLIARAIESAREAVRLAHS